MGEFRVVFITNYPSPYRVDFWNLLGKQVDLTVVFTSIPQEQHHRSEKWFNNDYSGFRALFLKRKVKICGQYVCVDIFKALKMKYDFIILGGYSSGTQMVAIEYLRLKRIPFILEADGGLIQKESFLRRMVKQHFISAASAWMSSGKPTTEYFIYYGADHNRIYLYPFTSQKKEELDNALSLSRDQKRFMRRNLGIKEEFVALFVGQMIHRKGIDILLEAATELPRNIGIYIVGGEPTADSYKYVQEHELEQVHFSGFKTKKELVNYYEAADLFVMPTREDVWGLVINEAMSYGLPVVSTNRCGAALALVEDGVSGVIVQAEDVVAFREGILEIINRPDMSKYIRNRIQKYSIENMVESHMQVFRKLAEV